MDGENFTDISIRNNKLSNSFCPEIDRSTQAVSKQVSGTHCKKVKRGMSLADYFCTCLVKCKHCTRRWDGFLSNITASTSPSLVTGVSFGSRKMRDFVWHLLSALWYDSNCFIAQYYQVQDCRAKTLICVRSSGQGYVCSVFQVVKKPKQLSKVFDPNLFWLLHLWEWPPLVVSHRNYSSWERVLYGFCLGLHELFRRVCYGYAWSDYVQCSLTSIPHIPCSQARHPPKHCYLPVCCNLPCQWFLWRSTLLTTRR